MKKNKRLFSLAFAGLFALVSFSAAPAQAGGIALDRMIIEFKADKRPVENLNVTNQDEKPAKVVASVTRVFNSGQANETTQPAENLIVAPKSFELAPGETRTARLVLKSQPEDMEGVYRVVFTPSIPSFYKDAVAGEGKISVHIGVIVAMGALVMVPPKNPKPDLKFERKGDKIVFTNNGNITATLQREEFCTEDRKFCIQLEGRRIYPGVTWEMEVPEKLKGKPYSQTLLLNGKFSKLSYPAN